MGAISETLRQELLQPEFSEGYAESFQDALVATQIKVLREDNQWTQADLAAKIGTTQTAISRIENVNYSAWNISTLKKLARAFRVRLRVSFETYGSLIHDMDGFSRESLRRAPREKDPELITASEAGVAAVPSEHNVNGHVAKPRAATVSNLLIFPSEIEDAGVVGSAASSGNQAEMGTTLPSASNSADIVRLTGGNNSPMLAGSATDQARVLSGASA